MVELSQAATPFILPKWITGNYYDYGAAFSASASVGAAYSADTLYATLLVVPPGGGAIDRLSLSVLATGTATLARVGVMLPGADGKPGALLFEGASTLDVSTTGSKELTLAQTLPPGLVFPIVVFNGTCTIHSYETLNTSPNGWSSPANTSRRGGMSRALTYGALPTTWGASVTYLTSGGPRLSVRAA